MNSTGKSSICTFVTKFLPVDFEGTLYNSVVPFKSITRVQIKQANIREETCLIFFLTKFVPYDHSDFEGGNYLSRWLHTQDYLRQKLSPFLVKKYDLIYIFILKLL